MERKGQGSLEYLLVLAAVLAIAGIVVYVILGYTSRTEDILRTQCKNAMDECKYKKASLGGRGPNDVDVCSLTCRYCYELDMYINRTRGGPHPGATWEAIVKNASNASWLNSVINPGYYYDCIHQSPF